MRRHHAWGRRPNVDATVRRRRHPPPSVMRFSLISMRGFAASCLIGALLGCQSSPAFRPLSSEAPPVPDVLRMSHGCKASGGRVALGRPVDSATLNEARMHAGADTAATVWPDDPPLAHASRRLLIDVDMTGHGRVARCG